MGVFFTVEIVRTEEPLLPAEIVTMVELKLVAGPWWMLGATLADRVMVPENPLKLERVMVEVPEEPR